LAEDLACKICYGCPAGALARLATGSEDHLHQSAFIGPFWEMLEEINRCFAGDDTCGSQTNLL
jgi:hypothetical protein